MKKILSAAVALLVLISSAIAEYSDPILFRGISWELPFEEYRNALIADIYTSLDPESAGGEFAIKRMITETPSFEYYSDTDDFKHEESYSGMFGDIKFYDLMFLHDETATYAGYTGFTLNGKAMPVVENGEINNDPMKARVTSMEYLLSYDYAQNGQEMYSDIMEKLISIYGEADEVMNNERTDYPFYIWHGESDTFIRLHHTIYPERKMGIISVTYGITNADVYLDELLAVISPEIKKDNKDGM